MVLNTLVACKTGVASLQSQTIPRLELLGALLLARLVTTVATSLSLELTLGPTTCYSDSQIALFWIKGIAKDWKPFVHNRVREIRGLVPIEFWHHCSGEKNPADLLSRVVIPSENEIWWQGPTWLREYVDIKELDLFDMPKLSASLS